MGKYLGEKILEISKTEYKNTTKEDWILLWVEMYNIDGEHHKQWLLDQIIRILKGTKIIIKLATWDDGYSEHRFSLNDPSEKYLKYVKENNFDDGCGIAP